MEYHIKIPMRITEYAFQMYVHDIRELVKKYVLKETATGILDKRGADYVTARRRRDNLNRWLESKFPLTYGLDKRVYTALVLALAEDNLSSVEGLPHSAHPTDSLAKFAEKLYDIASPGGKAGAPFMLNGFFLPVLQVAIEKMGPFAKVGNQDLRTFAIDIFMRTADDMHINFIPDRPLVGGRGRASVFASATSWTTLGEAYAAKASATHAPSMLIQICDQAVAQDARAPWRAKDLRISELHLYLNRVIKPEDWSLTHVTGLSDYVRDTYVWAENQFASLQRPLHQLAMFLAIIFQRCLPGVFHDRDYALGLDVGEMGAATKAARETPWLELPGRKGVQQREPFLVMGSTLILACMDSTSPLIKRTDGKGYFGQPWTKKHGRWMRCEIKKGEMLIMMAGNKALIPFNLIRLHLAWAKGQGAWRSATLGSNWGMESEATLLELHKKMTRMLREKPYGPYDFLTFLLGREKANLLAAAGECKRRVVPRAAFEAGPSKTPRGNDGEEDDVPSKRRKTGA